MQNKKPKDWHPAMIIAHLRMHGTSLRKLSKIHSYAPTTLSLVIQRPWTKGEHIIANAIGVTAEQIWPSRYLKRTEKRKRITARTAHADALNKSVGSIRYCSHGCNVNLTVGE